MQKRDVVKFNGQPVEVELAYATGKEGQNEHGPYYTYGLAGDKVMFATPALNQAIQNLKPAKGTRLSIHLAEGNRWEVKLHPPAEQPRTPTPPAARQTAPPDATTRNDSPITSDNHSANGNGNGHVPMPVETAPWLLTGQGQYRLQFYQQAVDLAIAVKRYAHAYGLELEVRYEDIRCMGHAGYIDAQHDKGGR